MNHPKIHHSKTKVREKDVALKVGEKAASHLTPLHAWFTILTSHKNLENWISIFLWPTVQSTILVRNRTVWHRCLYLGTRSANSPAGDETRIPTNQITDSNMAHILFIFTGLTICQLAFTINKKISRACIWSTYIIYGYTFIYRVFIENCVFSKFTAIPIPCK